MIGSIPIVEEGNDEEGNDEDEDEDGEDEDDANEEAIGWSPFALQDLVA